MSRANKLEMDADCCWLLCRAQQGRGLSPQNAWAEQPRGAVGDRVFPLLVFFCLFEKPLDLLLVLDISFICLGSGLKGRVVSLGLLSINTCLYFAEVQAVLFIYLFNAFKVIKHKALSPSN